MASLSSSRSLTRKRALVEPEEGQQQQQPPRLKARRDVLSSELATIQAELEHERSLRSLDEKRFEKERRRLERKIEFAVDEANEAKSLMEEIREESDHHIDQLRNARVKAQMELRECQVQLEDAQTRLAKGATFEDPKIHRLEDIIQAKTLENEQLQETIESMKEQISNPPSGDLDDDDDENAEETTGPTFSDGPPAVMKELNRVRIQLAESERKNRQLRRAVEDLQKKAKQLVQERESARSANSRVKQLEQQVKELVQKNEMTSSKMDEWIQFGTFINKMMMNESSSSSSSSFSSSDIPPETSKVQRFLNESKSALVDVEGEKNRLEKELEKSQGTIQQLENSVSELDRAKAALKTQVDDEQKKSQIAEKQLNIQKAQESVWQREMDSLRAIVKAFDELPLQGTTTAAASRPITTTPSSSNDRALQVKLEFAQEEIKVLKEGRETVKKDLETVITEKSDLQKTHNTVLEKFGKLKDALMAERKKAEQAQERACRAEELAGKGSFNPEKTRVLHLQQNPLTEALRQEVAVLKRQIQVLTKEKPSPQTPMSDVDPNKLHQRLKESFKEQIGRFREGVYLMTGFKIDMIPGTDRPRFKVRSVFAEQEQDHLMFQWPTGKDVKSLDLLNTDLAKALTTTPSYEYISRFHSLPAFLASVQLSLYEKQTMM